MRTFIFLMLLLQTVPAQNDSLLSEFLNISESGKSMPAENIEIFFTNFFPEISADASALFKDTSVLHYFDIIFNSPPEYNLTAELINLNFNYLVKDKNCSNSNRNGVLLLEKSERTPPKGKEPEKLFRTVYVLIPDKCSTTRFYNSKKEMFCDNKRQFRMGYEEGIETAGKIKVRVGMQLLSSSRGDYYETLIPFESDNPVETLIKEYVLRCCIRSIVFLKGEEIMDNFVSLK
jgi:hypothetical protein